MLDVESYRFNMFADPDDILASEVGLAAQSGIVYLWFSRAQEIRLRDTLFTELLNRISSEFQASEKGLSAESLLNDTPFSQQPEIISGQLIQNMFEVETENGEQVGRLTIDESGTLTWILPARPGSLLVKRSDFEEVRTRGRHLLLPLERG